MYSNRASLSQADLLVFHWSCRKLELRASGWGEVCCVQSHRGVGDRAESSPTTPGIAFGADTSGEA